MNQAQQEELNMLSASLFGADVPKVSVISDELKREAVNQAVYLLVQNAITGKLDGTSLNFISHNMHNHHEYKELHQLMKDNKISYVVLKGWATSLYYPNPQLRCMGDVDFLVKESDFERAKVVLEGEKFRPKKDSGGIHVAFHRPPKSIWEMHWHINGESEKVKKYMENLLEAATEVDGMMLPTPFHHCLIILCHMASHMLSEGIGLRHLCDWAVFVNKVDVGQWKEELEDCGLYRFAQVLSLVSVRYLHLPYQHWFGEPNDKLTEALMEDILSSGNFGVKDIARFQQVRYIADRGTGSNKPAVFQLLNAVGNKAEAEGKSRLKVAADYMHMVRSGKRKMYSVGMVREANRRKKIYSELGLFER